MRRTVIIYGFALAALTALLKLIEYNYFIRDLSLEVYLGVIAIFFTILGIWAGTKIINRKTIIKEVPVMVGGDFVLNETRMSQLGISPREYEVLELMSGGMSNQEIADKLFISLSTVKTHTANLYLKLDVRRRTQAVQKAKEMQLIP
ncbi:MAG: winged helix-turn-helix transcriptional regulator [Chitinophagaceae bacterium]|nr:winged helix-turn-helix transcriptional regulator [Chitinophagaceae bacterium]MCB9045714.1 winged helix-turn-helix transcriptional regulator [Chitinophagales bacterium]